MLQPEREKSQPTLQFHIEPDEPIEVAELTSALDAVGSQYDLFSKENEIPAIAEAKLLVSSVSPGSIDINFVLGLAGTASPTFFHVASTMAPYVDAVEVLQKFGSHLKSLLSFFRSEEKQDLPPRVTVRDCDDAINLVSPIAKHGGSQTFNIINGPVVMNLGGTDQYEARRIASAAARHKAKLQFPLSETRQRVSMVWSRLDRDPAKVKGVHSPDEGLIEEIDPKSKAILFTDELSYLKKQMLDEDENPMKKVYFVDVEISRVGEKITAYRIVGYHGNDDLSTD